MSRANTKLTKRTVDAASPNGRRYVLWDAQMPGFGLRVSSSGTKTFILRYRPKRPSASKRYVTLGRYGIVTVEQAREGAKRTLGAVAGGQDPAKETKVSRSSPTLAAVAADFLADHVALKRKAKTLALYRHALENHILPKLGRLRLSEVTRSEVSKLHEGLASTPYMGNYVVTVLSSLYGWSERRGLCVEGCNPARRVEKFRERRRERFLSTEEFARLGAALREAETVGIPYQVKEFGPKAKHAPKEGNRRVVVPPDVIAAIRLLLVTGARLREILHLRWSEVDLQRGLLLLADSKTGRKTVTLGTAAADVLTQLPRVGGYVFPGQGGGGAPRCDLKRPWKAIIRRAGLAGVRIHDLRHSYAATAAGAGFSLLTIGKLLGHAQPSTTQRYAHLADDPVRWASDKIADQIAEALR